MPATLPIFGVHLTNQHYRSRPGAYGVITNPKNQIAIIRIPRGCFLPGGGIEPNESPPQALLREIREECGCNSQILEEIGQAMQYVDANEEGHFAKHSTFFRAAFVAPMEKPIELDHELLWLAPDEAVRKLKFPSQSWAIARSLNIPHVACALIIQDKKILLGKRSPREATCPNQWDLFGGHLEPNETPTQALVRELHEELGIHPEEFHELRTMLEYNPHLGGPVLMHLYTVTHWNGNIQMLGDEHSEIRWFSISDASLLQNLAHPDYRELFRLSSRIPEPGKTV